MKLIEPSETYEVSYRAAIEEMLHESTGSRFEEPAPGQSFAAFVQRYRDEVRGIGISDGRVPASMYWLVDGDDFIGRVQIRHRLTGELRKLGGHIGYVIHPSKRRMGYGTRILKLGIAQARKLGIGSLLLTCDEKNTASRKIIEANGGILQDVVTHDGGRMLRFWIHHGYVHSIKKLFMRLRKQLG